MSTSTALLSRSNSAASRSPFVHQHSYSPVYPSHRHSRSLDDLPLPLPSPHSDGSLSDSDDDKDDIDDGDNPARWDILRLVAYLRAHDAHALADWVLDNSITPRSFLRLSPSGFLPSRDSHHPDLSYSLRDDLFKHSRALRLLALRSRIRSSPSPSPSPFASSISLPQELPSPISRTRVKSLAQAFEKEAVLARSTSHSRSRSPHSRSPSPSHVSNDPPRSRYQYASTSSSPPVTPANLLPHNIAAMNPCIVSSPIDEPSIEDLLTTQSVPMSHSWGANAWENDILIGGTARKVPVEVVNHRQPNIAVDDFGFVQPLISSSHKDIDIPSSLEEQESSSHPIELSADSIDAKVEVEEFEEQTQEEESVDGLKARLELLEKRIKELEDRDTNADAQTDSVQAPAPEPDVEVDLPVDLPQYILMAGVGVCALVGQALLRRLTRRV